MTNDELADNETTRVERDWRAFEKAYEKAIAKLAAKYPEMTAAIENAASKPSKRDFADKRIAKLHAS